MIRLLWILLSGLMLNAAQAASFDCGKAAIKVEKLICADAAISKLDEDLAVAYKAALQDEKQADAIRQAQKQWLKGRSDCADAPCLNTAYTQRITQLQAGDGATITPTSVAKTPLKKLLTTGWGYMDGEKGRGYTVCDKVKKRLNQFKYPEDFSACSWRAIATMPGFTAPPWQDIDHPKQHEALLYKLARYSQSDPEEYFAGKLPKYLGDPEGRAKKYVQDFLAAGGRLQVWRTHLPMDSPTFTTADVTLVRLLWKRNQTQDEATCKGFPFVEWSGAVYPVTDDLVGPDPQVGGGVRDIMVSSDVLLYAGKPYFVASQYSVEINTDLNGIFNDFCTLQYSEQER